VGVGLGALAQVTRCGRRGQPVLGQCVQPAVVDRVVAERVADPLDQPPVAVEDPALLGSIRTSPRRGAGSSMVAEVPSGERLTAPSPSPAKST
jgi:hypothetical protein